MAWDSSPSPAGTTWIRPRCAGQSIGSMLSRSIRRYRARNSPVVDSGSISPPPITTNPASSAIESDAA